MQTVGMIDRLKTGSLKYRFYIATARISGDQVLNSYMLSESPYKVLIKKFEEKKVPVDENILLFIFPLLIV